MARPSSSIGPIKLPTAKKKSKVAISINDLEEKLKTAVAGNASLNPLVELLDLTCKAQDPRDTNRGIHALHRVIALILATGKLSNTATEEAKIVRTWIWERIKTLIDLLTSLLADEEKILKVRRSSLVVPFVDLTVSNADIYIADIVFPVKTSLSRC
jgi:U3 small nucleolar RNA-associated protein 19